MRKPEDDILIACTRLDFGDVERERVMLARRQGPIDWDLLCRAAIAHRVANLVDSNLKKCGPICGEIPDEVRHRFSTLGAINQASRALALDNLTRVIPYFHQNSHDVMVVKGAALDIRLPQAYRSTMSDDVDIVVRPRDRAADREAEEQTWLIIDRLLYYRPRWAYRIEIDNQRHHDVVWNGVLPIDFRRVWDDAIETELCDTTIFLPCDLDLLLMACINVHRKRILRLRSLLDIAEIIKSNPHLDWDGLARRSRDFGCPALVYSAILATRETIGCASTDADFRTLRVGSLRSGAVRFVIRRVSPSRGARDRRCLWALALRVLSLRFDQLGRWFRLALARLPNPALRRRQQADRLPPRGEPLPG
jgi:hypothetical protein